MSKATDLFSTYDAETILNTLIDMAEIECSEFNVAKDKYKVKMEFLLGEEEGVQSTLEVQARICKVDDQKVCVELSRVSGDMFTYYQYYKKIQAFLGELINASN